MNDFTPPTISDDEFVRTTASLSHTLAGRACDAGEDPWRADLAAVLADHPSAEIRGELAARCSLGLLRRLVEDPDPYVRWCATANLFCRDDRIQTTLAGDPDGRVVAQLLANHELGRRAVQAIIDGPHTEAKATVAARTNLLGALLEQLAADPDPLVRRPAARTLAARRDRLVRLAATRQLPAAPRDLPEAA
ncbi:MAG: hypothetical protein JJU45_08065 [Acidimicrobiia bacterium]|nr:hypothetical protein [Acidimicrobiia bacterium]